VIESIDNTKRVPQLILLLLLLAACGSSIEDQVAQLSRKGPALEQAKQELLLAKDRAVPALLAAFDDPQYAASRPELVEVLVGLTTRVDDPNILEALRSHLRSDADPQVRARICRELGIYERADFANDFAAALEDTSSVVRGQAMVALRQIRNSLSVENRESLLIWARVMQDDEDRDGRMAAGLIVANRVREWMREANKEALSGQLAVAESLYKEALAFSPHNKRASLTLARFYDEQNQREKSLQVRRDNGWLLDVPWVDDAPVLDGRLDDEVWQTAAKTGAFQTWSRAEVLSSHHTEVSVVYTEEAIYFGAFCEDAYPESLIVQGYERDHDLHWQQDLIEFFIDTRFNQKMAGKLTINSAGVISDGSAGPPDWGKYDYSWDITSEAAGFMGEDFWSVEYRIPFGQPEVPRPGSGTRWGDDMQRGFRDHQEWSQWTPTYGDMGALPETYGWFLFE